MLRDISRHGPVGPAITDLDQSLGRLPEGEGGDADFGIELVFAFRVNAQWAVATAAQMTPRGSWHCPPSAWTTSSTRCTCRAVPSRYRSTSPSPSPAARPWRHSGTVNTEGATSMCPQAARDEVAALLGAASRSTWSSWISSGTCWPRGVEAASPPWDRPTMTSSWRSRRPTAPVPWTPSTSPCRTSSTAATTRASTERRSPSAAGSGGWCPGTTRTAGRGPAGLDDLASHLAHCKGFFLHRGALNDFR